MSIGRDAPGLESGEVVGLLRAAGWPEVQEGIAAGLAHDLNGRASALSGLVDILASRGSAEGLLPHFRDEAARLARTTALFGLLARRPGQGEPLRLKDVLDDLLDLHRRHRGLERVAVERGPFADPVVSVEPALTGRAILIALADTGWRCRAAGIPAMSVALEARAGEARLVVDGAGCGELAPEAPLPRDGRRSLARALEEMGGSLAVPGPGTAGVLGLVLPALG